MCARADGPVAQVTADSPPFLVLRGAGDAIMPFAQGARLPAALRRAGVRVDFRPVSGGDQLWVGVAEAEAERWGAGVGVRPVRRGGHDCVRTRPPHGRDPADGPSGGARTRRDGTARPASRPGFRAPQADPRHWRRAGSANQGFDPSPSRTTPVHRGRCRPIRRPVGLGPDRSAITPAARTANFGFRNCCWPR
ncbi:hypothetical protein SGPA1_21930 [Streptomyces misionensis JCM 4497]